MENTRDIEVEELRVLSGAMEEMLPGGAMGISLSWDEIFFAGDGVFRLTGYTCEEIKGWGKDWYRFLIHPEDMERMKTECRKEIEKAGTAEFGLRLIHKNGSVIWIWQYCGLIYSQRRGPYLLCLILDDAKRREAERQTYQVKRQLETLVNTIPGGVAQLNVEDGFRILSASEGYYKITGYTREELAQGPVYNKAINLILGEDVPVVLSALQRMIDTGEAVQVEYRIRRKDGTLTWNTAYCSKLQKTAEGMTADVVFIDTTRTRDTQRQLGSLIDSIPGGVARFRADREIFIDYANETFFSMLGYTEEEFFGGSIRGRYAQVIYPEDREMVLERAGDYVRAERKCPSLDYRVVTAKGEILWMRATASRVDNGIEQENAAQCIIYDITESKKMEQRIALNEERYRILSEQSEDVIFDWDMETGNTYHSPAFKKKFGYALPEKNTIEFLFRSEAVYLEDQSNLQIALKELQEGKPYVQTEYRIKKQNGEYIWCRARITAIYNEKRKPCRAIGILSDVDTYKKEAAFLQEKADRDSLTGLLNRMAAEQHIDEILEKEKSGVLHAFYLIDVDDFKWINDSLGHAAGDFFLMELAARMKENFNAGCVIGRLGGDEFAVFMERIPDLEAVRQIAEKLNTLFCQSLQNGKETHTVTCSMGVALYPGQGTSFQALYQCADKALYQAKRRGKNQFLIGE